MGRPSRIHPKERKHQKGMLRKLREGVKEWGSRAIQNAWAGERKFSEVSREEKKLERDLGPFLAFWITSAGRATGK